MENGDSRQAIPFYLRQAYFENSDYQKAIELLQPIVTSDFSQADEADWLVCLSNFQLGNLDIAKQQLKRIRDTKFHDYGEKAEDLFGAIDKPLLE